MNGLAQLLTIGSTVVFLGTATDIETLQQKYGVSIEPGWMNYTITTYVNNSYPKVATAPISATPADLERLLQKLRDEKIYSLEKDYGIRIGKEGSSTHQTAYGQMHKTAESLQLRLPKLQELYALEYALEHSSPSQQGKLPRERGVNVYFLKQESEHSANEWGFDAKNKASIFLEPRTGVRFGRTLEETLMHQFAHNSAYRMGWNPHESWRWPLARDLGWVFAGEPNITEISINGNIRRLQSQASGWLLRTNEGPNYFYKQSGDSWIRCDMNLHPLDDAGKPASMEKARKFSSERIIEYAMVKPVSPEFPTPPEVFADGLAMFRAHKDARAELLDVSPRLYNIVKTHDQKELDAAFGKGKKVRSVDGKVVDPTPQVMTEIRRLEEGMAS